MCKCNEIMEIWNKIEKTQADVKALSLLVPSQFETDSSYYDEDGVKNYVIKCIDCGKVSYVPHI